MRKKGGLEEEKQQDLLEGEIAASSVLVRANEAIAKEERQVAVDELLGRVEDWKGHDITHFGELLLYGSHTVLKGEGQKEVEREVRIILDTLHPFSHFFCACCYTCSCSPPSHPASETIYTKTLSQSYLAEISRFRKRVSGRK